MLEVIKKHLVQLSNRQTTLMIDGKPAEIEQVTDAIDKSVISVFEERCMVSGVLVAQWLFNRDHNKFILGNCKAGHFDMVKRLKRFRPTKAKPSMPTYRGKFK